MYRTRPLSVKLPTQVVRVLAGLVLSAAAALSGCTTVQRVAHLHGSNGPAPLTYEYKAGGASVYYTFTVNDTRPVDTLMFFYGGSGCASWKAVMPDYVDGFTGSARIFVLNKRFVGDRSTGLFACGRDFHLANHPDQWVADYSEFIAAQLSAVTPRPRHVVLVGVSEGTVPAVRAARRSTDVTHLVIIGSGGYTVRNSLSTLRRRGEIYFDVDAGWKKISANPRSLDDYWYGNPHRWWSDVLDLDPLPDFLALDIPVLVGFGEQDQSVPVQSAEFLAWKFRAAGKKNLALKVYPGADHRLTGPAGSHRPELFAELSRLLQAAQEPADRAP